MSKRSNELTPGSKPPTWTLTAGSSSARNASPKPALWIEKALLTGGARRRARWSTMGTSYSNWAMPPSAMEQWRLAKQLGGGASDLFDRKINEGRYGWNEGRAQGVVLLDAPGREPRRSVQARSHRSPFSTATCPRDRPRRCWNACWPTTRTPSAITPPRRLWSWCMPEGKKSFKAQIRSVQRQCSLGQRHPRLGHRGGPRALDPGQPEAVGQGARPLLRGRYRQPQQANSACNPPSPCCNRPCWKAIGLDPNEKYRSDREDGPVRAHQQGETSSLRSCRGGHQPRRHPGQGPRHGRTRWNAPCAKPKRKEAVVHALSGWNPTASAWPVCRSVDLIHDQTADVRYEERGGADQRTSSPPASASP
jgi:hypothetical protein